MSQFPCHPEAAPCTEVGCITELHCELCGKLSAIRGSTVSTSPIQEKRNKEAMNSLSDMVDKANDRLEEVREAARNLSEAETELEDFVEKLKDVQSLLEELDGYSVSVDVESFNFDLTFQL